MGSTEEHSKLVNDILVAINAFPRTRALKMTTGAGFTFGGNPIKFGVPGQFDILVLRGKEYFWLDAKTGGARLSADQRRFQAMVRMVGGVAEPVHSVAEALKITNPV